MKTNKQPIRVLFLASGNSKNFVIAPFIKMQGDSLKSEKIVVKYFKIQGKGIIGYLNNIKPLRKYLQTQKIDIIHAHFTLSAWVAVLSFTGLPIILSLMGTDAFGRLVKKYNIKVNNIYLTILTLLIQPFVEVIISKSKNIEKYVWKKKKSIILPNGVDLEKFNGKRLSYRTELGLKATQKYILFLGNPYNFNKNFKLLEGIRKNLQAKGFEIINPYPLPHDQIPKFLSSVDILVMCSFQEGSPNVVKEAMASNCKGVFTDVGDVKQLVKEVDGYVICGFKFEDLEKAVIEVDGMKYCHGRERIKELGLDTNTIARKLNAVYNQVLKQF